MAEGEGKSLIEQARVAMAQSLQAMPGELGAAVKAKAAQGASELASALYTGSGFVQYGAESIEPQQQGQEAPDSGQEYAEAMAAWQQQQAMEPERQQGPGR